jgi:hypothetical protein
MQMSKTRRNVSPKIARSGAFSWDSRKRHMLLKGVKTFRSDKCMDARTDSEGNFKLDTWSETPQKTDNHANRSIRRTARVQIARQLEEA